MYISCLASEQHQALPIFYILNWIQTRQMQDMYTKIHDHPTSLLHNSLILINLHFFPITSEIYAI